MAALYHLLPDDSLAAKRLRAARSGRKRQTIIPLMRPTSEMRSTMLRFFALDVGPGAQHA